MKCFKTCVHIFKDISNRCESHLYYGAVLVLLDTLYIKNSPKQNSQYGNSYMYLFFILNGFLVVLWVKALISSNLCKRFLLPFPTLNMKLTASHTQKKNSKCLKDNRLKTISNNFSQFTLKIYSHHSRLCIIVICQKASNL